MDLKMFRPTSALSDNMRNFEMYSKNSTIRDLEDEMFTRITICTYAMLVYGGDCADLPTPMITQRDCGETPMHNSIDCNVFTTFFDDSNKTTKEK